MSGASGHSGHFVYLAAFGLIRSSAQCVQSQHLVQFDFAQALGVRVCVSDSLRILLSSNLCASRDRPRTHHMSLYTVDSMCAIVSSSRMFFDLMYVSLHDLFMLRYCWISRNLQRHTVTGQTSIHVIFSLTARIDH